MEEILILDSTSEDSEEEIRAYINEVRVRRKYGSHRNIEVKKDNPKEKEVHWNIESYSPLPRFSYIDSPFFTFLNVQWYIRIDPTGTDNYVALSLTMNNVRLAFNMLCTFAIKMSDESLVEDITLKHMFQHPNSKLTIPHFITRHTFFLLNEELMSSGKLTILCNLKQLPDPAKLTELHSLSEDIRSLFTNGEFCDIILRVKDREFKVHKTILAARSPVFARYFSNEASEEQNDVIDISDCDPSSFPEFLEYLYSGKLENISPGSALNLYKTASKYDVMSLKLFCVEHMEQNLDIENFFDFLSLTDLNNETYLFNAAQEFFNRNLNKIFTTSEWKNLMRNNLNLANKLLLGMSSDVLVISKRRRLQ